MDLAHDDNDDDAHREKRQTVSALREHADAEMEGRLKKIKKEKADHESRAERLEKEKADHESRAELLDTMVMPLEEQRRMLQAQVTEAATALIEADVPTRVLPDDQIPFYYASNSWENEEDVPWNAEKSRPMTLAEGVKWTRLNPKRRRGR